MARLLIAPLSSLILLSVGFISHLNVITAKQWTVDDIPYPITSLGKCGLANDYGSFMCDPEHILSEKQRKIFSGYLSLLPIDTPCFCKFKSYCESKSDKFVFGLLILNNISGSQKSYSEFAKSVRINWKMGSCDNDALILVVKLPYPKIIISYGRIGKTRLSIRCRYRINKQFSRLGPLFNRISKVVQALKTSLAHPCACGDCSLQQSWYKMMAWLFAGILLLSSLSFFSRRLWLRHSSATYNYSPRFSLWNRQSNRRTSSQRPSRSSLRLPSVIPPRITLARSRIEQTNDDVTGAALNIQSRRLNRHDNDDSGMSGLHSPPPYSSIQARDNCEPAEDYPTLDPPPYSAVYKSDVDDDEPNCADIRTNGIHFDDNCPPPPYTDDSANSRRNH